MDKNKKEEFGAGPFPVTEISHCIYQLKNGVNLAMKVWLPCKSNEVEKYFPYFAAEEWRRWSKEIYTGTFYWSLHYEAKVSFGLLFVYYIL